MNKIKVGLFLDTFYPTYDGATNYMHNLALLLSDVCEFTVFCPGKETEEFYKQFPYKVVHCKSKHILNIPYDVAMPKSDKAFINELNNTKLDLIHIHSPFNIGKIGYHFGLKNNIPIVTTFHTQYKRDIYRFSKSLIITNIILKNIMHWVNKSNEVWTNNNGMIELLKKSYKCKSKMRLMHNFTSHSTINYLERIQARNEFRQKYDISDETKLLLFVGRLIKQKNIFFLIKVAKILRKNNFPYKLIFVGDGGDEKKLKDQVRKNKLTNEIIFLGKIRDVHELETIYAISDLFVFPSKYDTNSLVQLEAAAQFLPALFLKNSITSSTVEENWTGFISDDNPSDYAQKIMEIFNSPELYKTVREHCHTLLQTGHQIKDEIYNGYQNVLREFNKPKK